MRTLTPFVLARLVLLDQPRMRTAARVHDLLRCRLRSPGIPSIYD